MMNNKSRQSGAQPRPARDGDDDLRHQLTVMSQEHESPVDQNLTPRIDETAFRGSSAAVAVRPPLGGHDDDGSSFLYRDSNFLGASSSAPSSTASQSSPSAPSPVAAVAVVAAAPSARPALSVRSDTAFVVEAPVDEADRAVRAALENDLGVYVGEPQGAGGRVRSSRCDAFCAGRRLTFAAVCRASGRDATGVELFLTSGCAVTFAAFAARARAAVLARLGAPRDGEASSSSSSSSAAPVPSCAPLAAPAPMAATAEQLEAKCEALVRMAGSEHAPAAAAGLQSLVEWAETAEGARALARHAGTAPVLASRLRGDAQPELVRLAATLAARLFAAGHGGALVSFAELGGALAGVLARVAPGGVADETLGQVLTALAEGAERDERVRSALRSPVAQEALSALAGPASSRRIQVLASRAVAAL